MPHIPFSRVEHCQVVRITGTDGMMEERGAVEPNLNRLPQMA